jgi:hypothetical protein
LGQAAGHTLDEPDPLLRGKHRPLVDVDHHADDQMVEDPGRPLDDVEVAVRNGIKAAGIDRCTHENLRTSYDFL